jgi:hypothetical protein
MQGRDDLECLIGCGDDMLRSSCAAAAVTGVEGNATVLPRT